MDQKRFSLVAGAVFAAVAVVHILRIILGWPVMIDDWTAPMWVSWIAVIVTGALSYSGLTSAARA